MDKAKEILDAIEDKLRTNGVARIVTHLDADGLASASILCKTLKHLNIPFHLRVVKQLTTEIAKDLLEGSSDDDFIIFTDLGSGHKDLLRKLFSKRTFAIIDHHIPSDLGNDLLELNPHIFGFDGSKECSASTACYFIAKACKLHLAKIAAKLAIVGAIGDRQDCGDKSSFIGLNEVVVKEAIDLGILRCKMSLKLFGAETRPIFKALEYTSDPYLPGLTGNELACKKFLENLGICTGESCSKTLSDLSDEELKKLTSELINHLLSHGVSVKSAESLVGWIYTFIDEAEDTPFRDAREFAFILNACGRMGKPSLGIFLCLGCRESIIHDLREVILQYRKVISRYLDLLYSEKTKVIERRYLRSFHGGTSLDEKVLSTIASIAATSIYSDADKVFVGFSTTPEYVKVSVRGSSELALKGVNLGELTRKIAEKVGGSGGGHISASGAQIPIGKEEEFLDLLEKELAEKLEGKS